jgi:rhodanese-related sulfurtransferase
MNELTVAELSVWKNQAKQFQLIDIREEEEIAVATIGGISIPMDQIINRKSELRQDIPVVIHCNSGKRSAAVVYQLSTKYGMTNVYTLCGGLQAYAAEVDPGVLQQH